MHDGNHYSPSRIYAWKHGPVVNRVYSRCNCKWHPIELRSPFYAEAYAPAGPRTSGCCLVTYGEFRQPSLKEMTHEESPWLETL